MNNNWLKRLLMSGSNTPSESPFSTAGTSNRSSPQQLDSFLANSMSRLNMQQRESVLEELHGIRNSENPESNPASVDLWLQMLDMHLQSIKRGTVYEVAEAMDRRYVTSRSFRMLFLRASRYEPQAAAHQMIKHLELKRSLFGQEKLTKKIKLTDLNSEDKEFLESGAVQISRKTDRSGRGILLVFPSLNRNHLGIEAMVKARYYTIMSMTESEENQKHGVVFVYFGALPSQPNQHSSQPGALWELPIFIAGIHGCLSQLSYYLVMSVVILRMPLNLRPRIRIHYGDCTESLYKLSSFGIARDAVLTDTNEPPLNDHFAWYRQREEMELAYVTDSDADTLSVVSAIGGIVPEPADVLFGPGSRKNKGNLVMRNLVLGMLDEHNESRKGRKMQLTETVIDEVKKQGGRFLKQNEETKEWEEASHVEVSRKIAHTFRNIRRPSRAKKQG